jgi:hypothetical protein
MNTIRNGRFTSSEIHNLLAKDKQGNIGLGAPAKTYIEEKNMERLLGLSLDSESNAKPLVWGKLLEGRINDLLPASYTLLNDETFIHPQHSNWCGSPDVEKYDTSGDTKCPITRKSFCQLVQPIYDGLTGMDAINAVRKNHKEGEKYYWQIVSNAVIRNKQFGELIVYMPYESELPSIKQIADGVDGCMWIQFGANCELPYIKDGGYYKNINIIRFEVPKEDKDLLVKAVENASKLLIEYPLPQSDTAIPSKIMEEVKAKVTIYEPSQEIILTC